MAALAGAGYSVSEGGVWQTISEFPRWMAAPTVLGEFRVKPRWHVALKHAGLWGLLAANSFGWYWLGAHFAVAEHAPSAPAISAPAAMAQAAQPMDSDVSLKRVAAAPLVTNTTSADAITSGPTDPDLQAEDAAGLRIEKFRVGAVSGYPNRLQYELALSNKGRKLEGRLEFVVSGEQDGAPKDIPLDASALSKAKPRVEVARLLTTRGYLELPEGYVVHKVQVHVLEDSQPRVAQIATVAS